MTTITLDEITRNATLAALDERAARLEKEVARLTSATNYRAENGYPETDNAAVNLGRALVWNIAALHETLQARETIGETEPATPEQADDMTAAKAYHDWQAAGPVA